MNLFKQSIIKSKLKHLCLFCNNPYSPDKRNLNRGWGLFCSKSCSASYKNKLSNMSESEKKVEIRRKKLKQIGL